MAGTRIASQQAPGYLCMQSSTRSDYQRSDCYRICIDETSRESSSNFQTRRTKTRRWGCLPASLRILTHRTHPLHTFDHQCMFLASRRIDDLKVRVLCARICGRVSQQLDRTRGGHMYAACCCDSPSGKRLDRKRKRKPDLGLQRLQILDTLQWGS